MKPIATIINFFEEQAFGVCEWWGKKLGISTKKIRMYFIYLSFFTADSPVIIYFMMAFLLENKDYFKPRILKPRRTVWEL